MVDTLDILSSLTSEGSDWPYIFLQLYEGANHMSLPKDKHLCVLPQEKAESPSGHDKPTKNLLASIHQAMSVVFPVELNRCDQLVTIDLPESLHAGSSVTTDECPYIEINIPTAYSRGAGLHASLLLSREHDTTTTTQPKTPWKPRVTLMSRGERSN